MRFGLRFTLGKPASERLLDELAEEGDSSIEYDPNEGIEVRDGEIFGVFCTNGGCEFL